MCRYCKQGATTLNNILQKLTKLHKGRRVCMAKNFFNIIAKTILDTLGIPTQKIMHAEYTSRNLPPQTSLFGEIKSSFLQSVSNVISHNHIFICKDLGQLIASQREELNLQNSNSKKDPIEVRERQQYSSFVKQFKSINQSVEFSKKTITSCLFDCFADAYWIAKIEAERKKLLNKTIQSKRVQPSNELNIQENNERDNEIEYHKDENNYQIAINNPAVFRNEFQIGFLLSELRFYNNDIEERIAILKTLLTEENYNRIFNDEHFDFKQIRFSFLLNHTSLFSSVTILGYLCGYCSVCRKRGAWDEHKAEVLNSLEQLHIVTTGNEKALLALLDEISYFSYAGQCENILRFLNPAIYNNDNSIHTTIRAIMENCIFENNTLTNVRQYIVTTRKLARIAGNNQVVEACDWLIVKINDNTIDDDYLQDRINCQLWASDSQWPDTDYFENLCMNMIEAITIENDTRNDAIENTKQFLSIAKKSLTKERDIQIYERVLLEYSIATDEEYSELRATLLE